MKTQNISRSKILLFICLQLLLACSDDNGNDIDPPIPDYTVSDLDVSIAENPGEGAVLGKLTTDLPGNLTYTSDNAAFAFDVSSLEVTVADSFAFDYELNTAITGTITLSNGAQSVRSNITVLLTDLPEIEYTASHLNVTIQENPPNGTLLGTLATNLTGPLTYSSDNDAFEFDVATLEVYVANTEAFDFEMGPEVSGTITISSGGETVASNIVVQLTDVPDLLADNLTVSKEAFLNAAQGDWIEITQEEFQVLENVLEDVSYSGIEEGLYPDEVTAYGAFNPNSETGATVVNKNEVAIPAGSYLFALRLFIGSGIFTNSEGNKVKISDSGNSEGFVDIGDPLPKPKNVVAEVFFVLKGNRTPTENPAFLGLFVKGGNGIGFNEVDGAIFWLEFDDTANLDRELVGNRYAYQGLSTTKAQWD